MHVGFMNRCFSMASWQCIGFVDAVKILKDSCILYLTEYKKGYRKSDGTVVEDRYHSWKVIFKGYFIKYITSHFGKGMLVEVKGEAAPYAVSHGKIEEGFSIIGQTCNIYSYPRYDVKIERKMMSDSAAACSDIPNVDEYNAPDF